MSLARICLTGFALLFVQAVNAEELATRAVNLLHRECGTCHGKGAAMSNLVAATREGLLKGGTRGAALVPGKAGESLLVKAIEHQGALKMPPTKALAAEEIAILRKWINAGAPWPADLKAAPQKIWWAFQEPQRPEVPRSGAAWVRNPIDEFIFARLRKEGLEPAPEADRHTFARRLAYNLTGLPLSAERTRAFALDTRPDAYEKLVDELLDSPRYGERWGRHWLDLARYSDTAGFELDSYIADAWRYRDWVIQAFQRDMPYDRFIREQLAGDEFSPEDPDAQTGTGFFCVGPNRDLYPDQADINRVETLTDYTDTTASVFLGLTMGCARCHDHKFDPLTQRDYYRLQAVFEPAVKTRVALNRLTSLGYMVQENNREIKLREIGDEIRAVQERCQKQVRESSRRERVSDETVRACFTPDEAAKMAAIEKRLVAMFSAYREKPFACGITDPNDASPKTFIPAKGASPKIEVGPGFPAVLGGGDIAERSFERPVTGPIPLTPTTGRRHALAGWIASPENPLTARVMVNRIWQYHFGRGLVSTPSDFGTRAWGPSHPELLDWLASEFTAKGWSIKAMHRLIVTSAVYRQSAKGSAAAAAKDPENLLLSHFTRRRMDSDEIHDSILEVTGRLNSKMGGRPVVPPLAREEMYGMIGRPDDAWIVTSDRQEHYRRGIYMIQRRTFRLPVMEVFDAPDKMLTCARRDSSNTAPQSLTLLNGAFAIEQAQEFALKLARAHSSPETLLTEAWRSILKRDPEAEELASARAFLERQQRNTGAGAAAITEVVRGLLNSNEFIYID
jgi:mono/diheme cytochrome c family protein